MAPCTPPPPQVYHQNFGGQDFAGGVQAGYNWQRGHTVFGTEGDVSFGSKIDYLASLRGRAGWAEDNWLFYGTGGVGFIGAQGKGSFTLGGGACVAPCTPAPSSVLPFDVSEQRVGYVVGGGVETKLTRSLSAGVEGLYYGFDGATYKQGHVDRLVAQGISEVAVVRGRFSWHFNDEGGPLK
jgi:opacity protein-like surface antigen